MECPNWGQTECLTDLNLSLRPLRLPVTRLVMPYMYCRCPLTRSCTTCLTGNKFCTRPGYGLPGLTYTDQERRTFSTTMVDPTHPNTDPTSQASVQTSCDDRSVGHCTCCIERSHGHRLKKTHKPTHHTHKWTTPRHRQRRCRIFCHNNA